MGIFSVEPWLNNADFSVNDDTIVQAVSQFKNVAI